MSCNSKSSEAMIKCYSRKTKETIESIKELESRLADLSSSGSDNDDAHLKEKHNDDENLEKKNLELKKNPSKKGNNKRKKRFLENSLIIEDEIEEYVPMGGDYRLNNNMSGKDIHPICIEDSPITVIDDEVQSMSAIDKSSVVVLDDTPSSSANLEIVSVNLPSVESNSICEIIEETTCRRSKRLKKTTSIVNYMPTRRNNRKGRNRRESTISDDIPVITFDEEYPIPQCSYFVPKQVDLASTQDSVNKVINYDTTSENVTVYVSWRLKDSEKFEIPRYRPLKSIFDHYAEKENIPVTCVVLTKDMEILTPKDTPDSAEFKCVQLLKGYKANVEQNFEVSVAKPVVLEEDDIELKVLLKNKRALMLTLKKYHSMKVIVSKCAAQLECAEEDVVLFFDGEKVNPNDTPEDLDLQSGECVDAHVKNSN